MAAHDDMSNIPFTFNCTPTGAPRFRNAGRNAHFFQPPKSPAVTPATPSSYTANDYFTTGSKKRSRADTSYGAHWNATPHATHCLTSGDGAYNNSAFGQGSSALVNERYRLAAGHDTPSLQATAEIEDIHFDTEDISRRRVRDCSLEARPRDKYAMPAGPLARERNGVARGAAMQDGSPTTWTGLAFNLVGKVFTFGTSMIRGFYAGQGEGFEFRHDPRPDLFASQHDFGSSTPVPGQWHDDEFLGDFEQDNPSSSPAPTKPLPKRRQTDRDAWVMVGTSEVPEAGARRTQSGSTASRNGYTPMRPQASRASSRRSMAPLLRRQSSQVSYAGSPGLLPAFDGARRASVAPTRSPHSRRNSGENGFNAYVSPEAERFAKRQAKQDRATDKAMSSMTKRLEDLIRQGQEALGTKISIEGVDAEFDTDEGFVDESW
nr:hypothetical protein CFP56_11192 [Quercus suber]